MLDGHTSDRTRPARLSAAGSRLLDAAQRNRRRLWLAVGVAFVADVVLTAVGLELGLSEANPVGAAAIERAGVAGLVGLKLLALAAAGTGWSLLPDRPAAVIPLALAATWLAAAAINLVVVTVAL